MLFLTKQNETIKKNINNTLIDIQQQEQVIKNKNESHPKNCIDETMFQEKQLILNINQKILSYFLLENPKEESIIINKQTIINFLSFLHKQIEINRLFFYIIL